MNNSALNIYTVAVLVWRFLALFIVFPNALQLIFALPFLLNPFASVSTGILGPIIGIVVGGLIYAKSHLLAGLITQDLVKPPDESSEAES